MVSAHVLTCSVVVQCRKHRHQISAVSDWHTITWHAASDSKRASNLSRNFVAPSCVKTYAVARLVDAPRCKPKVAASRTDGVGGTFH